MNVCTCECVLKILILNVNTQFTDIGRPRVVDFILTCQIPLTFQSKWRTLTLTHVWLRNKHYLVLWTNKPIFETSLLYRAGGYCNIFFHISAIQNSFQCHTCQKKLYIYTNAYFFFSHISSTKLYIPNILWKIHIRANNCRLFKVDIRIYT